MQTSTIPASNGSVDVQHSAVDTQRLAAERLRGIFGGRARRPAEQRSIADAPKSLSVDRIGSMSLYDLAELLPA